MAVCQSMVGKSPMVVPIDLKKANINMDNMVNWDHRWCQLSPDTAHNGIVKHAYDGFGASRAVAWQRPMRMKAANGDFMTITPE